jgi:hypothetical protein
MAAQKYMQWQIIAPPATRFFQLADGNFSLYFERTRIDEMVAWAEAQAESFRRLGAFIAAQAEESKEPATAATPTAPAATVTPATPAKPKVAPMMAPNIKTVQPGASSLIEGMMARGGMMNRGIKSGPGTPNVGAVGLTTQAEVEEVIPVAPPRSKAELMASDPGLAIALAQQRRLDAEKGIDRDAKNNAPDEPPPEAQEEEHPLQPSPAAPLTETPPTEGGATIVTTGEPAE